MYQLMIRGETFGKKYRTRKKAWKAYLRMRPCILGLWYRKVNG